MKNNLTEFEKLYQDYGWKLFPLTLAIILLLVPRLVVWVLYHVSTALATGSAKFLKVTEI